ncbi:unnamed protein product, partial [Nesidiocoris tenuis]
CELLLFRTLLRMRCQVLSFEVTEFPVRNWRNCRTANAVLHGSDSSSFFELQNWNAGAKPRENNNR